MSLKNFKGGTKLDKDYIDTYIGYIFDVLYYFAFQRVANVPKQDLPQCPVGPKSQQLETDECPLHVNHPPTGEEFALGCGICRNAHTF